MGGAQVELPPGHSPTCVLPAPQASEGAGFEESREEDDMRQSSGCQRKAWETRVQKVNGCLWTRCERPQAPQVTDPSLEETRRGWREGPP